MDPGQVASSEEALRAAYHRKRMAQILAVTQVYAKQEGIGDARNLRLVRGESWARDMHLGLPDIGADVGAPLAQDEIFPVIDTLKCAMAQKTPHVSVTDPRSGAGATQEADINAKTSASHLNWNADEDRYGVAVQQACFNGLVFDKGGCLKVTPDAARGVATWRSKLPWNVFVDANADRIEDVAWVFERCAVTIQEFHARVASGVYRRPKRTVEPDAYPLATKVADIGKTPEQVGQVGSTMTDAERKFLAEYVCIYEYWDCVDRKLIQYLASTGEVLFDVPWPYELPYYFLWFHDAIGTMRGVSDVTRLREGQRDISELINGRAEVVRRLVGRLLVDRALFKSDEEVEAFKKSKAWDLTLIDMPGDMDLSKHVFRVEGASLNAEFDRALAGRLEHQSRLLGVDRLRAQQSVRTAEQVSQIAGSEDKRLESRMLRVLDMVTWGFKMTRQVSAWMFRNYEDLGLDLQRVYDQTADPLATDMEAWYNIIIDTQAPFTLEPFAPLMENSVTRRQALERLLTVIAQIEPMSANTDWRAVWSEIISTYRLNPALLAALPPPPPPAPPEMPAAEGAPPGDVPPELMAMLAQTGAGAPPALEAGAPPPPVIPSPPPPPGLYA